MPLISKNYNYDLALKTIAPNGLSNTENLAIGNYNGSNFALEIASDIGEWLSKNFGNVALVKDCYLCFYGNNDVGDCYVTGKEDGASDAIRCDDYAYKVPLLHLVGEASKSNPAYFYCPQPNGYTTLQLATAWIEADVLDCSLSVPEYELHVYKKDDTLDLSKVHVYPKAIFTNADGQPEEVELERSSYSLSLTSEGEDNYLNVSYLNQTVQKTISLHEYKDFFDDPDTENEGVLIYGNDNASEDLKMDIYFPAIPESSPCKLTFNAVITLHGGGWSSGTRSDYTHHKQRITDNGLVCVNMDYSLLGSANIPNDITPCVKMLDDISAAISTLDTTLNDCGLILGKVALMGYSAGGHLALLYAFSNSTSSDSPISLVVAEAAPTYFVPAEIYNPSFDDEWEELDVGNRTIEIRSAIARNLEKMTKLDKNFDVYPDETELNEVKSALGNISPLNYLTSNSFNGKVLLAYATTTIASDIQGDIGNYDDGYFKINRGTKLRCLLGSQNCKLHVLYNYDHEALKNTSILTETCAKNYLDELTNVLQAFGRNEDIEFE